MAKENKPKDSSTEPDEQPVKPFAGIDIHLDEQGRIIRNFDLDAVNRFLDENVPDKKFAEDKQAPV